MACAGSTCQGGFHTYALEWDRSTDPEPMLVDYVSIMQRNGGTPPPPPPPTCGPLVSQGKTATSSAVESANLGPQYAVDGNPATRWSSAFSDPQWTTVDLGSVQPITRVKLTWEAAYATAYSLQVSNDNANWTTAYSTATGAGGVEDLAVTATGRYVRLYGTQRATFNRGVAQNTANWYNPAAYYTNTVQNDYAKFFHTMGIDHRSYAFAYDDVNDQSSVKILPNANPPTALTLTVGW
jgi:hypothetical protein